MMNTCIIPSLHDEKATVCPSGDSLALSIGLLHRLICASLPETGAVGDAGAGRFRYKRAPITIVARIIETVTRRNGRPERLLSTAAARAGSFSSSGLRVAAERPESESRFRRFRSPRRSAAL